MSDSFNSALDIQGIAHLELRLITVQSDLVLLASLSFIPLILSLWSCCPTSYGRILPIASESLRYSI